MIGYQIYGGDLAPRKATSPETQATLWQPMWIAKPSLRTRSGALVEQGHKAQNIGHMKAVGMMFIEQQWLWTVVEARWRQSKCDTHVGGGCQLWDCVSFTNHAHS